MLLFSIKKMIKTNYSLRRKSNFSLKSGSKLKSNSSVRSNSTRTTNPMYLSTYQRSNREVYDRIPSYDLIGKNKKLTNLKFNKQLTDYFKNKTIEPSEMKKREFSSQFTIEHEKIPKKENCDRNFRMSNSLGFIQRMNNNRQKSIEEKNKINITKKKYNFKDFKFENKAKERKFLFLNSDSYNKILDNNTFFQKQKKESYNSHRVKNKKNNSKNFNSLKKNNKILNEKKESDYDSNKMKDDNKILVETYLVKTKPKNDRIDIKKMFLNSGIHIYDIEDKTPYLSNDHVYEFKLRLNNDEKTNNKLNEIKRELKKKEAILSECI